MATESSSIAELSLEKAGALCQHRHNRDEEREAGARHRRFMDAVEQPAASRRPAKTAP